MKKEFFLENNKNFLKGRKTNSYESSHMPVLISSAYIGRNNSKIVAATFTSA